MRAPSTISTAFVFPGGGSLAAAQIGMLDALLDAGVQPDIIVGASAGAINAVYFAGRPGAIGVRELRQIWADIRRSDIFPVSPLTGFMSFLKMRNHTVDPRPLRRLIQRHLTFRDLDEAPIPCYVVATDLLTGNEVVLSTGPALPAVLASASIPGVFPPVELSGRALVDGGLARRSPISVAISLGVERVILFPTGFSCAIGAAPGDALTMALHGLNLLIARQVIAEIEMFSDQAELRVIPPLCPMASSPFDFSRSEELIDRAAEATVKWLAEGGLEDSRVPESLQPHSCSPRQTRDLTQS